MFSFGVDYYPEHWPEERWPLDARMMQEACFNTVRLAEFAWSRLEPQPGRFDFAWLDRAIDILSQHGMQVILGTPTASPPPWVMSMHPDAYRVNELGMPFTYGNRRAYCPTHAGYRERSRIITQAMAEHYARHQAVIGWQTDNEFGDRCYCSSCRAAFQSWLQSKYPSLDTLNAAWGTIFWSHTYSEWSQIPAPLVSATFWADGCHNPGLALDYHRFMSDAYVAFQAEQMELLRRLCPDHFITHNFMGFGYDRIDYFDLAADLDFVSWDNYRRMQWTFKAEVDPAEAALAHAAMRGLKRKNFWVMEQQGGPGGWQIVSVTPRPGELRLWAYQSIAHGADGIIFFRWRTARFGTEQYWHGLLEHDARPSRRYQEIKRMGAEIKAIGDAIAGATVEADVALLVDYDTRFAFQIQANNPAFNYAEHCHDLFAAFHKRNVAVDVISPGADLSRYKLVIAPALYVLGTETAESLRRFTANGGVLVVTPRTGVKDEANAVVETPLPGLLADVCGIEVEEYDSLPEGVGQPIRFGEEVTLTDIRPHARVWCDVVKPVSAEAIAHFTQDYYAGAPAVTRNRFGAGQAIYVATFGDEALFEALADWLLGLAQVTPGLTTSAGVEVCERRRGDERLIFVLNHTGSTHEVAVEGSFTDLLSGERAESTLLTVAPRGVYILRQS